MKKRDMILLALAAIILIVLWNAPEETTHRVPHDANHERFFPMVQAEGKKKAEAFCEDCHNENIVPFPADHPGKRRCLLCHRLSEP